MGAFCFLLGVQFPGFHTEGSTGVSPQKSENYDVIIVTIGSLIIDLMYLAFPVLKCV